LKTRNLLLFFIFLNAGFVATAQKGTVTDIQGTIYKTVKIGNQFWMAENLSASLFNDGTAIPLIETDPGWGSLTSPGYCYLFNDPITYKSTYGALYNWYTVNSGKLCPAGWHVPSDEEWEAMINGLGGSNSSGSRLKISGSVYWGKFFGGTNSSGFSALPGKWRTNSKGCSFPWNDDIWKNGRWWSSSESLLINTNAICRDLDNGSNIVGRYYLNKANGCSVRCVKN
jgi:uncharacterized protein (TIGR02145 family)